MNQILAPFINDLLKSKGYTDEQNEKKELMRQDLTKKLDDFIMVRTITEFSKEDLTKFQNLLDEKKPKAELQQFAIDHIPDYTTFLTSLLIEFQEVYLSTN